MNPIKSYQTKDGETLYSVRISRKRRDAIKTLKEAAKIGLGLAADQDGRVYAITNGKGFLQQVGSVLGAEARQMLVENGVTE
jgi:hypothetical protein